MNTKKHTTIERKSFLDILMQSTPEELNDFIISKSKPPKMMNLVTFLDEQSIEEEKKKHGCGWSINV